MGLYDARPFLGPSRRPGGARVRRQCYTQPMGWQTLVTTALLATGCAGVEAPKRARFDAAPSPVTSDAGDVDAGGIPCGAQFCRAGRVCCESCGVCARNLVECGALTGCEPVDAGSATTSDGGWTDGAAPPDGGGEADGGCIACEPPLESCRYEGTTCESCGELVCECDGEEDFACPPTHYCQHEGTPCGRSATATGRCVPKPAECTTEPATVCACNAANFNNACLARAAGHDVFFSGFCPQCDFGLDARGEGGGDNVLGFIWDSGQSRCVPLQGATCRGRDCDILPETRHLCELLFGDCSA